MAENTIDLWNTPWEDIISVNGALQRTVTAKPTYKTSNRRLRCVGLVQLYQKNDALRGIHPEDTYHDYSKKTTEAD